MKHTYLPICLITCIRFTSTLSEPVKYRIRDAHAVFFHACAKGVRKQQKRKGKPKKPRPLTNKERQALARAHWEQHHGKDAMIQEAMDAVFSSSSSDGNCDSALFNESDEVDFIPKHHNISRLIKTRTARTRQLLSPDAPATPPQPATTDNSERSSTPATTLTDQLPTPTPPWTA